MVGQVISYNQHMRSESAFRRGDSDAMMLDYVGRFSDGDDDEERRNSDKTMTAKELEVYYMGFEQTD